MRFFACPVALHPEGAPLRIPVFERPQARLELLRTAPQEGENPAVAAAQALFAQGGLETRATLPLGKSEDIQPGALWHFILCRVAPPVRARWQHPGPPGSDGTRRFCWHPLGTADRSAFAPPCREALDWLERTL